MNPKISLLGLVLAITLASVMATDECIPGTSGTVKNCGCTCACTGTCPADECAPVPMDIIFVLDMSQSVNRQDVMNWARVRNFTYDVVSELTVAEAANHIGIVRFAGRDDTHKDVLLTNYDDADVLSIISNLAFAPTSARTKTNFGLNAAREMFTDDGRDDDYFPYVVIVVTDGKTSEPDLTPQQRDLLVAMGADIIAVGVGDVSSSDLMDLSSSGTYFEVENFSALSSLTDVLLAGVCGMGF